MLPIIGAAMALAEFVPGIVGWIKGDKAQERAEQIVGVAKAVAGVSDPVQAVSALQADPALVLQFQEKMQNVELEFYREDTKRMGMVNETMRAEASSEDAMTRRWRPLWGYISAGSFGLVNIAVSCCLVFLAIKDPVAFITQLPAIIASLVALYGIPGAILGITAWHRGKMQRVQSGEVQESPLIENKDLSGMLQRILAQAKGEQP